MPRTLDSDDPIRDAAAAALAQIMEPLCEFMLDTGITVQEVCRLFRNAAVRSASARVVKQQGRLSKSRVAIVTGLSRAEVNRCLRLTAIDAQERQSYQHPARRLLAAWFDDPSFQGPRGKPMVLPIFGRTRSFEHLVREHGGGLPVRAMLDELLESGAVEQQSDQTVRAKARVPSFQGLTARGIDSVGERGRDLLRTLTHNMRRDSPMLLETTAQIEDADLDKLARVRGKIMDQGHNFMRNTHSLLVSARANPKAKPASRLPKCRVGVTIYYFQDRHGEAAMPGKPPGRRNLTRRLKR